MTEDTEVFSLSLKGEGISIEKNIDKQTAAAVMAAVMGDVGPVQRHAAAGGADTHGRQPGQSIREFLNEVKPKKNSEQIVAIGHFVCRNQGTESFSRDDVISGFRKAHEPLPKNLPRDFKRTIQAGWIHEAAESGRYYVTNTGIRAVENQFGRKN